jgi:hypothetical protein
MFGMDHKNETVKLGVQVYALSSEEAFGLAQKIWDENARTMRLEERTRKEFLRFGYANPKCVVWLQRDQGRTDTFELIVGWFHDKSHEVFTITSGQPTGNVERAKAILTSMLTTPSVVLSNN